jgi:hypothetical protein
LYFNTSDLAQNLLILIIQGYYQIDYYNPKDGSVVNFDSTKCQTTAYFGHLEPVLTGISQGQNKTTSWRNWYFYWKTSFVWIEIK